MENKISQKNLRNPELSAGKLKKDNSLFKLQKELIGSYLKEKNSVCKHFGAGEAFKINAREYLKEIGLL